MKTFIYTIRKHQVYENDKIRKIQHKERFTEQEFKIMCEEVDSKDVDEIARYLIYKYGFKTIPYNEHQASYNIEY